MLNFTPFVQSPATLIALHTKLKWSVAGWAANGLLIVAANVGGCDSDTDKYSNSSAVVLAGWQRAGPLADARFLGVGERVADFTLTDLSGTAHELKDLCAPHHALVMVMREVSCPVAMRYGPRLAALESEFAALGIGVAYVNISETDSNQDMTNEVAKYGFGGLYCHDRDQVIRRSLRPATSTEVFVIDAARTLRYRGAVDDQYGLGVVAERPSHEYLRAAVDDVLYNRAVRIPATRAPGCVVDLEPRTVPAPTSDITWHKQISRIFQAKCQNCHQPETAAPFTLDTYESVRARRAMIRQVVADRLMPPWGAAPTPDGQPSRWDNDLSLNEQDRSAILSWIDNGCAAGNPKDAPQPIVWNKKTSEWEIGTPDAVFQIEQPFSVPAEGVVDYQYFTVKTDFPEDRWVTAIELQPTSPAVVHHVVVILDETDTDDASSARFSLGRIFAIFAPGFSVKMYPPGQAKKLPAGARMIFQMHYTPNGTAQVDQTRIALRFSDTPPQHEIITTATYNLKIRIPAGVSDHTEISTTEFEEPLTLFGVRPHMHLRGKAFRFELEYPGGKSDIICDVPRFDFDWQFGYSLAEPIVVPAGTRLRCIAWYDNSAANPANPDPTKTVRWGDQIWDEMLIGYYDWTTQK